MQTYFFQFFSNVFKFFGRDANWHKPIKVWKIQPLQPHHPCHPHHPSHPHHLLQSIKIGFFHDEKSILKHFFIIIVWRVPQECNVMFTVTTAWCTDFLQIFSFFIKDSPMRAFIWRITHVPLEKSAEKVEFGNPGRLVLVVNST